MSGISFSDRAIGDFVQLRRLRQRGEFSAAATAPRRLTLGRRPDGTYLLADADGRTVRESRDLARLVADMSTPEAVR